MSLWSRRKFFMASLAGTAAASTTKLFGAEQPLNGTVKELLASQGAAAKGTRPIMISSANGVHALQKGHGHFEERRRHAGSRGGRGDGGGRRSERRFGGLRRIAKGKRRRGNGG